MAADYPFLDILWTLFVFAVLIGGPIAVVVAAVVWRRRNGSRRGFLVIGLIPILVFVALTAAGTYVSFLALIPSVAGLLVVLYALVFGRRAPAEPMAPPN